VIPYTQCNKSKTSIMATEVHQRVDIGKKEKENLCPTAKEQKTKYFGCVVHIMKKMWRNR